MADDWAFNRSKLPLPTYLKCSTPEETLKERHIALKRIGKKYNAQTFCQEAIAQRDFPLIKFLVEVEKVDLFKLKYSKSTGIGRRKRITPLEFAERKKWTQFYNYVRSLSKTATDKPKEDDDDASYVGSSYSENGVSEDSSTSSFQVGQYDVETFHHDQDYPHIAEYLPQLLTKLPNEKYQFLHWVEMSMVSLIDKKRATDLAPKACWLMCALLAIFRDCHEHSEFLQQANDFWKSLGAVPPFTAVKFEDHLIYYTSHPFVVLVNADVGMGTEARERATTITSFLRIISRFQELYETYFTPEDIAAGRFDKFSSSLSSSSSSTFSSYSGPATGVNELPPENAAIPRGFLGTLGKEHKQQLGNLISQKSSSSTH